MLSQSFEVGVVNECHIYLCGFLTTLKLLMAAQLDLFSL